MENEHLFKLIDYCYRDERKFVLECLEDEEVEKFLKTKDIKERIRFMKGKDFEYIIYYSILHLMLMYDISISEFEA